MRLFRQCTRISILSLLAISVFTAVFLLSFRLKNLNSDASRDFVEDLSILKHRIDAQANSAVQLEEVEGLKGPHLVVYRNGDRGSLVSLDENDRLDKAENVNLLQNNGTTYGGHEKNQQTLSEQKVSSSREKEKSIPKGVQHSRSKQSHPHRPLDEKVKEMKDNVIKAKAYLSFTPPDSNSHFVKEIKLRIKELERAIGGVNKDSGLSRRAIQTMKAMEGTLLKASRIYPDCSSMVNTLRAMTYNAEEQLQSQRDKTSFLVQLAATTTSKGFHCLSMLLTTEYFANRQKGLDPRYASVLNHLRFYLPDIFPSLSKIVLLNQDVVVQKDLTRLWRINIKGKVNGAVDTCVEGEPSFRRMDMFINFPDPSVATKFDANTCTWAFGMNVFDLQEGRKRNLTASYKKYLELGSKKPLLKGGSLPIGWMTFYKHTYALDRTWHLLGLGYYSGVTRAQIEQATVVHYDGYKPYWNKHVSNEHPYLQQCNLHE
ncbi:unnamed protein product [Withania somnifera]